MSDGSIVDLTNAEFFYTTDDSTVATISQSGTIKAIKEGTANIWVYVKVGDYWVGNSTKITVTK